MALDAFVYCDCFERNDLRCDPPAGVTLKVEPTGGLGCDMRDEESWPAFLEWKRNRACLHQGMILLRHRLGAAEQVDQLRAELQRDPDPLPILVGRVLYSGTHTCDMIPVPLLGALAEEVKRLAPEKAGPDLADAMQLFKIRMAELVIAARHAGKPICF